MSHAVSSAVLLQLGLGGSSSSVTWLSQWSANEKRPLQLLYVLRPQHELSG